MIIEVAKYVEECGRCVRFRKRVPVAPLVPILTTELLELLSTDFLKMDTSSSGLRNILVITVHFTRYTDVVCICVGCCTYNVTPHELTGLSAYFLMFCW